MQLCKGHEASSMKNKKQALFTAEYKNPKTDKMG